MSLDLAIAQAHRLVARHENAPGCVWHQGMVGPSCRPPKAQRLAAQVGKDPSSGMGKYANNTTWLLLALIGIAIIPGLLHRIRVRRPALAKRIVRLPLYSPLAALCRWVGYYQPRSPSPAHSPTLHRLHSLLRLHRLPPLGPLLVMAAFSLGLFAWCLAVKPWYRPAAVWGSTPLGLRSGMIAIGMTPFVFVFAMKVNPVTWLTAISHERLQLYHQWLARLMLLFSLVHGISFLWQPLHDGGASNLHAWFVYDKVWWTGSVCISLLIWIVASSIGAFRNFSYEFFVIQHVVTVILFLAFLFLHTRDMQRSWSWLWPVVAVWGFATLYRWSNALRQSSFGRAKAMVEVQVDDEDAIDQRPSDEGRILRIALNAPTRWSPAQHFFIRFPTLGPWQSHPFSVLSLASPDAQSESQIVFVVRVQRGLTQHLYRRVKLSGKSRDVAAPASEKLAQIFDDASQKASLEGIDAESGIELSKQLPGTSGSQARCPLRTTSLTLPAMVDGPYGSESSMASFDAVLLFAGGVGITFCLSILMDLATRAASRDNVKRIVTRKAALVWSVPSLSLIPWFVPYLTSSLSALRANGIDVELRIHVSKTSQQPVDACLPADWVVTPGRPEVAALVRHYADGFSLDPTPRDGAAKAEDTLIESMSVTVCGPGGMANDVANTVAKLQRSHVLSRSSKLKEVYLHNETFNW
ncbi:hypothetical protein ACQY0O_005452 [Thecaphora frezii]